MTTKKEFKRSVKKKGRKFIQIACRQGWVHALDIAGNVWEYHPDEQCWKELGNERKWE